MPQASGLVVFLVADSLCSSVFALRKCGIEDVCISFTANDEPEHTVSLKNKMHMAK